MYLPTSCYAIYFTWGCSKGHLPGSIPDYAGIQNIFTVSTCESWLDILGTYESCNSQAKPRPNPWFPLSKRNLYFRAQTQVIFSKFQERCWLPSLSGLRWELDYRNVGPGLPGNRSPFLGGYSNSQLDDQHLIISGSWNRKNRFQYLTSSQIDETLQFILSFRS